MRRLLFGSTTLALVLSLTGCTAILGDFEIQGTDPFSSDGSVDDADGSLATGDDASAGDDATTDTTATLDAPAEATTGDDSGDAGSDVDAAPICGALGQSCCASDTCDDSLNCINHECHLASTGDLGKPCSVDGECQSDVCLAAGQPLGTDAGFTGSVCTSSCSLNDGGEPDAGDAGDAGFFLACIPGWTCAATSGVPVPICKCQYAAETCNGKDDDCDGVADNGDPGAATCDTGKKGVCKAGESHCTGGKLGCTQTTQASNEICDGLDNDCNGTPDDGDPGGGVACSTGFKGVCAAGTTHCQLGTLKCVQNVQSSNEVCDSLDNDCNGSTDEGTVGNACSTGLKGACAAGTTTCNGGTPGCQETTASSAEVCDGVDNNCNNSTDEGLAGLACSTGLKGVCAAGTTTCASGVGGCHQTQALSAEVCDKLDNDCNGTVDDGTTGKACSTGLKGACAAGTTTCTNGTAGCHQTTQSSSEVCNNVDDNCDGNTDEGNPGGGGGCSTGLLGVCSAGTLNCSGGSLKCTENVASAGEVCDGLDNNCNGSTDEGVQGTYYQDSDGDGYGNPAAPTQACSAPGGYVTNASDCNDSNGSVHPGAAEVCDSIDNNCDGNNNEGNPGGGAACSTGLQGVCAAGTTVCSGTSLVCSQNQAASATLHTAPGANGSWDWNCDGGITEQYASNTYWPYNGNSCGLASTYQTICGFYSTGSCQNSTNWSGWQTYACTSNSTHCGETVYRYRCSYNATSDSCTYTSDSTTSESSPTGHYIYIAKEGCY